MTSTVRLPALAALVAMSCSPASAPQGATRAVAADPQAAGAEQPLHTFRERLERCAATTDSDGLLALFDADAFFARAMQTDGDEGLRDLFVAQESASAIRLVIEPMATAAKNGGTVKPLRVLTRDGEPRLLVRIVASRFGLGMDYWELVLRSSTDGVRFVDVEGYANGAPTSELMRRLYLRWLGDHGVALDLSGRHGERMADALQLGAIDHALTTNDAATAIELYESSRDRVKQDRCALVLRVAASVELGDDRYENAITALRSCAPNDPRAAVNIVNAYAKKGRWEAALDAMTLLDGQLDDPFVSVGKAMALDTLGREQEAEMAFREAIRRDPNLVEAYEGCLAWSCLRHRYSIAVEMLRALDERFPRRWSELEKRPGFRGLVDSPEYRSWSASRSSAGATPPASL
ncbi:MAG: tetratricopeptide repeat protein [Acidobacteriota bacterium]